MNAAQRNHNPINLEYRGQKDAIGSDGRFAVFPDDPTGWRAAMGQVRLDQARGLTIQQYIEKFAPPEENKTSEYIKFVCDELCVSPLAELSSVSPIAMAAVQAFQEGYFAK